MLTIRTELLDALTEVTLHARIASFFRSEFPDHVGHLTDDALRDWIADEDRRAMSLRLVTATSRSEFILLSLVLGRRLTDISAPTAARSHLAPLPDSFFQQLLDRAALSSTGES